MQSQEWIGLAGVAVGGGLTYLTQFNTARLASKNEDRRREDQRAESRRAEQLEVLREFMAAAQQAARVAEQREYSEDWDEATTPAWIDRAREAVDRLFMAERMIQILLPQDLHQRAWDLAKAVDGVLWRLPAETEAEGDLWDVLQQPQRAFLAAARNAIR